MAPFIDWPQPHDVSLGVPPARKSGRVHNPVIVIDGQATVTVDKVEDSCCQRCEAVSVVLRVGESDERARRDDHRSEFSTGHFDDGSGREVDGLACGELVAEDTLDRCKCQVVVTSPNPLTVSVTHDHRSSHEDSLTGHGANLDTAPIATTEEATSVVGDIVRDGADITPGDLSPVEKSAATGAADASALADRPHPINRPESGTP